MGHWNYDIYSNDLAMDTLCELKHDINNKSIEEILKGIKFNEDYNYNDSKLVIADFEMFYYGKVNNLEEIQNVINIEKSPQRINNWKNPKQRLEEITKLEEKIMSNSDIVKKKSKEDVLNWIKEKMECDILG